jgi:hypothetical protein
VVTACLAVLQELLSRRYYEVFYPRSGELTKAENNMWLTSCGTGQYNAADDPPAAGSRKLLVRSDKNW